MRSPHTLKELKELRKRIDKAIAALEHHPAAEKPRRHKRSTRKRISQTMQRRWQERKALRRDRDGQHEVLTNTTPVEISPDNHEV